LITAYLLIGLLFALFTWSINRGPDDTHDLAPVVAFFAWPLLLAGALVLAAMLLITAVLPNEKDIT